MFESFLCSKVPLQLKSLQKERKNLSLLQCKPGLLIEGTVSDDFKRWILEWAVESLAMRFFVSPFKACERPVCPRDCCQINVSYGNSRVLQRPQTCFLPNCKMWQTEQVILKIRLESPLQAYWRPLEFSLFLVNFCEQIMCSCLSSCLPAHQGPGLSGKPCLCLDPWVQNNRLVNNLSTAELSGWQTSGFQILFIRCHTLLDEEAHLFPLALLLAEVFLELASESQ